MKCLVCNIWVGSNQNLPTSVQYVLFCWGGLRDGLTERDFIAFRWGVERPEMQ